MSLYLWDLVSASRLATVDDDRAKKEAMVIADIRNVIESSLIIGIPQWYLRPVESTFPRLLGLNSSTPLNDTVVIVRIVKGYFS